MQNTERLIHYETPVTYNQFSRLIVHPRMWLDHFPASYSTALTDVIENYDKYLQEIN